MKKNFLKIDPVSLFSHELKTPLSSLKLALSLLEKDFKQHKSLLPLMKKEVDQMIDFIIGNLDLRYIQGEEKLFQYNWQKFEPIISEACLSLKLIAQKEKISFKIKNTSQKNFEVFIDSSWIICALKNLLSNALQASPENSIIFIEFGLNDKDKFSCSVRDEGKGILEPKKVFDLFYKDPTNKKVNIKNTGLGLSIAKAIVTAHNGDIQAFSNKKGTTFYFNLPQVRLLKQSA